MSNIDSFPFRNQLKRMAYFHRSLRQLRRRLVVRAGIEDSQDSQEQVDNVQIQANGGGDLFLDVMLAHDHLGVDEDVGAEEKSSDTSIDKFAGRAVGEKHVHEAEHDESPQGTEQIRHPRSKVILGLAGEESQEDKDGSGQDDSVENNGSIIEGNNNGDGVGFGEGKEREEEQVGGIRLALPVRETHEDHGAEQLYT